MHKILRALILSDLFILGGLGLVQPIFAVFMLDNILGTTVMAIGIATTVQLVVKAVFQVLVGKWTDEEQGNRRELAALIVGSVMMSLVPIGYVFSHTLSHIYVLQVVYGLGSALAYPGWVVVFMRYTRSDKAGYEWGIYNTTVSLGTAVAAGLGAYIAELYGFDFLFILVSTLSFIGTGFIAHIFLREFVHLGLAKKHRK